MRGKWYILWISHMQPGVQDWSLFEGTYEECVTYVNGDSRSSIGGAMITVPVYKVENGPIETIYDKTTTVQIRDNYTKFS